MLTFYFHLAWFSFLISLFFLSTLVALSIAFSAPLFISLDLFFVSNSALTLSFYFDFMAISFISVVSLISSVIMVYSFNYMAPYSKSPYFIWLTFLFIISMLLVVSMSNLFFVMLGWDGLGVVSFFLIVFYQNQSSITSGLFTLFINRLGDCFFLITLSLFYFSQAASLSFVPTYPALTLCILMCLTFITNSALFPFSPWLPLAIAAPTPISALVHSSTLVTSGLFLIIRYSYFILFFPVVVKTLIGVSVFTSFYAGLNSVFEKDLNNLIALSTLSHLGFIGLSFSSGLVLLAFFHLLTHALFNSLLFMAIGDTIVNLSHSQDVRYLSSGLTFVPNSSSYMLTSVMNLLGMPALSGFFSNDLVLETLNFSSMSLFIAGLVYFNVFLTFFYSFQLVFFCFQSPNNGVFSLIHKFSLSHSLSVFFLSLVSVVFGFMFLIVIFNSVQFLCLPLIINLLPFTILFLVLTSLYIQGCQIAFFSPMLLNYFSSIINLSVVLLPLSSRLYFSTFYLVKTTELGVYTSVLNSFIPSISLYQSRNFLLSLQHPFYVTLFSVTLFIILSL